MRNVQTGLLALAAVLVLVIPALVHSNYYLGVLNLAMIYAIAVWGLNIVQGLAGQVSLAQGAFYAIGAYVSMLLSKRLGLDVWFALPLSAIITAAFGLALGLPSMKLGGRYLFLVTLAFSKIVHMVTLQWIPVTGGPDGVGRIPAPSIAGLSLATNARYYYILLLCLGLAVTAGLRIKNSRIGRALVGIRDNEIAAEGLGVDTRRYKIMAFILSAAYGGLAGSLYAHMWHYIAPDMFGVETSILFLAMIVVGGPGSVLGPVLGAFLVSALPEVLRFSGEYYMAMYGVALVAIVIFLPGGIAGLLAAVIGRLSRRLAVRYGWTWVAAQGRALKQLAPEEGKQHGRDSED